MRKKLAVLVLGACAVTAFFTTSVVRMLDEEPADDRLTARAVVQSGILAEKREVTISLPESYQQDLVRRYPVLYVLDGSSQSGHTAESARLLARVGLIPDMINVGIPANNESRQRDYTPPYMSVDSSPSGPRGAADRFLRFIETELIPHIEREYRATSTRMLAGHSRGGLFVMYSLLERRDLFCARFAYSPALWRDEGRMVAEMRRSLKAQPPFATFIYLSLGDDENSKMKTAFGKAIEAMQAFATPELRWTADITRGANHSSNPILSTPVGMYKYYHTPGAGNER